MTNRRQSEWSPCTLAPPDRDLPRTSPFLLSTLAPPAACWQDPVATNPLYYSASPRHCVTRLPRTPLRPFPAWLFALARQPRTARAMVDSAAPHDASHPNGDFAPPRATPADASVAVELESSPLPPPPPTSTVRDVIIIGSGPAAHTAAIYAARAERQPLMFEGMLAAGVAAGGQLTTTTEVENFPGFPGGLSGPELTDRFRAHSLAAGTEIITETVSSVDLTTRPFQVVTEWGGAYAAHALIIATGATARRLDIPGAGEEGPEAYWQRGVSACAVCDGAAPVFRGKPLAVIGGGDTAMEEALFLAKYGSTVTIVHRRDELRASKVMQRRALAHPRINIAFSAGVVAAKGDGRLLQSIALKDLKTGAITEQPCNGLFFAVGHVPNTSFLGGQVALDTDGYVLTKPGTTRTSVDGLFAAGDVQDKQWRQAVTAAGSGCMAAMELEHYMATLGEEPQEEDASLVAAKSDAAPAEPAPAEPAKSKSVEA